MEPWWIEPMRTTFDGRKVVLAGAVAAAWTEHLDLLRECGATDLLVVATEGAGGGRQPDVDTVVVEPPAGLAFMERLHVGNALLADPPPHVIGALDAFDPDRSALVVGTFLNAVPTLQGRPFLTYRRPEWLALEDKVVIDAFWDRAGIARQETRVVSPADAPAAAADVEGGDGTVWAADAREGFHGGASRIHWVVDDASRQRAIDELTPVCDRVRVMPFLEGIPCSIHGIVLPDGVAVLRPVEMVTLRQDQRFVYAGCATFWDPPDAVRDQMRDIARCVGAHLADEVDFRGTFTVDGIVAADGFWPTELNPRFGAGINTIARAADLPILMLNELIGAGIDIGKPAEVLESELVAAADAHRGGGTWISGLPEVAELEQRPVVDGADGVRWADTDDVPLGRVVAGDGFVRCRYQPGAVPIGPSTAPLAARFWSFADRELGTGIGPLTPAQFVER